MDGVLFNRHLSKEEIEMGMPEVLDSPKNDGIVELMVRRPAVNRREVIQTGLLGVEKGLIGDNWLTRGSSRTQNGHGHAEMQLNIMNYRFASLVARSRDRIPLAGDQRFVDIDLSKDNLPHGTQLS